MNDIDPGSYLPKDDENVTTLTSEDDGPRRPGRPRLSDEEKARRKAEREANGSRDRAPKSTGTRGRPPGRADLPIIENALSQYVSAIGLGVSGYAMARNNSVLAADGIVIVSNADAYSHAWCELARTDKRVYSALRKLCVGGAWGGVVIATAAIVVPIAGNHGLLPAGVDAIFTGNVPDSVEVPVSENGNGNGD